METTKPLEFFRYKPSEKPGYITFDRMITYGELEDALIAFLKAQPAPPAYGEPEYSAYDMFENIGLDFDVRKLRKQQIPKYRTLYAYPVRGGSEGFYFHFECFGFDDKDVPFYHNMFTAKTLTCKLDIVLPLNSLFNQFILENE